MALNSQLLTLLLDTQAGLVDGCHEQNWQSSGFIKTSQSETMPRMRKYQCKEYCLTTSGESPVSSARAEIRVSFSIIANLEPIKGSFVDSVLVITSFASISDRIKSGATTSSATPSARKKLIQAFFHLNLHLCSTSFLLKLVEAAQVAS